MEFTLNSILRMSSGKYTDLEAFVAEDARCTYSDFYHRVLRRANCLLGMGLKKGEHVATLSQNALALLESIFALWRIGAVLIPLNFRLSPQELIYVVTQSDATSLIFSKQYEALVRQIMPATENVGKWLCEGESGSPEFIDFKGKAVGCPYEEPRINVVEEDAATILYTAGTTGKPKGVVSTHKNWVWSTVNGSLALGNQPEIRLTVYPLFHAAGLINVLLSVASGCTLVILREFEPRKVFEWIENEKVNRLGNPPTVYNMLLQVFGIEKYDLSSVKHLGSGAETMPDEIRNRLLDVFVGAGISDNYGMTESAAFLASRAEKYAESKPYSVGLPLSFVEIRVVDDQGRSVPHGTEGEIIARGPNIMKEYYNAPEKTAEALRDGWLYTQDLGRLDQDGFLYIVERKHHMIISGGENIYPKEVEDILYRHPKILEAAVFGVPDAVWGEKVCAAIVLKTGEEMDEQEVVEYCSKQLAGFKKPKSVHFVDALPKSAVGKVLRAELKEWYSAKEE